MSVPLTEKYRPKTLEEIVGNESVVEALKSILKSGVFPHMLFYGPPGTGKTTAIRALVKSLPKSSVLELNASDERGIATVRETIKEFASTYSKTIKLVILDEADMMSRDAQNALRRVIEDFSKNTRFCLIANYYKKIIPAILSRCTKFRFGPIQNVEDRIREICKAENIKYTEDGVSAIAETSDGDMRKVVNDIQGLSSSFDEINEVNVLNFNNLAPKLVYTDVLKDLMSENITNIKYKLKLIKDAHDVDCDTLITNMYPIIRQGNYKNKMSILKELADIEHRRSFGCDEDVQTNAITSAFIINRE